MLLLSDKLELVYDLEKFFNKIEQIEKDYYEVEVAQDIIFNQFIQKLYSF